MSIRTEHILSFFTDFLAINASYYAYYMLRIESGWVETIRTRFGWSRIAGDLEAMFQHVVENAR